MTPTEHLLKMCQIWFDEHGMQEVVQPFLIVGFLVGGAAFAWTIGTTDTATFSSGNTKTRQSKEKVCFEPKLIKHA